MWCEPKLVAGLIGVALLVGACGEVPAPGGSPSASPVVSPSTSAAHVPSGRDLAATGITVVGGGLGEQGLVADSTGAVWVDGPWQVARLDLGSGSAQVWTIGDDAAFARGWPVTGAWPMAGTPGSGVWLVAHDRVLLFDGTRFARELVVPARYGIPASVLGHGDQLWVRTEPGILLERTQESWEQVAEGLGALVVDAEGGLWSGARQRQPDGSWALPEGSQGPPDGWLNLVVTDPTRGIWGVQQQWLYRYDGSAWLRWQLPQVRVSEEGQGEWYPVSMAVTGGGEAWLAGDDAVVRRDAEGAWTVFTADQGLTVVQQASAGRFALAVDDSVLVTDPTGVLRFDGSRFVALWADPAAGQIGPAGCLHAVGRSEVWVSAHALVLPGPPTSSQDASPLARFSGGAWEPGGPTVHSCLGAAVAPDGAMWAITGAGLVRFDGSRWVTVDGSITSGPLAVGPDGVAWVMSGGRLVRVDPDGTRSVIGRPPLDRGLRTLLLSSGQLGVVWVGTSDWEAPAQAARWDGRWTQTPVDAWTLQVLAVADGSLWAEASNNETGWLIRWAEGRWTEVPGSRGRVGGSLVAAPGGGACATGSDAAGATVMTCFDAAGPTATIPLPEGTAELSIGRDGSTWVLGDQVARLSDQMLPWPVNPAG